jgi:hypothetical protein
MNTRRALVALAGGVVATALAAGAVPVGAQEPLLPISVTPGSGPAGTVATVSGTGCLGSAGAGDIEVYLFDGSSDAPVDVFVGTVAADGSWSFGLQFEATDALGVYDFSATCFDSPSPEAPIVADYDFASFELTAADPAPAPETPVAAPAAPVRAEPDFTG